MDVNRVHIIKLTKLHYRALKLFEKVKDPDLWEFLFNTPEVRDRMIRAYTKQNRIDGELMQRELNKRGQFAEDYKRYMVDGVYNKLIRELPKGIEERIKKRHGIAKRKNRERIERIKRNL
jgi:hypothetical protein